MNTRYIEINSTYRNRNSWPLPAEFEIPISQTGTKSKYNSIDPVSVSTPIFSWTSNNLIIGGGSTIIANIANPLNPDNIGYTSDGLNFIILTTQPVQQLINYYNRLVVKLDNGVVNPAVRRIINSYYLGSFTDGLGVLYYRTQITVFNTFSDVIFSYTDTLTIKDPTDFTDFNNPLIFVPNGAFQENAYNSYILYNETINEYRPISSYNAITNILKLNTSGSATYSSGPISGAWQTSDNFSIRVQSPLIPSLNTINPIIVNNIDAIIPFTNPPQIVPIKTSLNTIIITDVGLSFITDFYKNNFIRILPYGDVNIIPINPTDLRYEYDPLPSNNTAKRIIGYNYYQDNITLLYYGVFTVYPSFNSLVTMIGAFVEILPYSYDNFNPFIYSGSLVSQQEMVCYEVQLISLTLPNNTLNVASGGRIAFYPYVYVQLSNVSSASAGLKNIIYSNNPNTTNVIFRSTIYDVNNPLNTPFTRIDGGGMTQTIKFKPNDNLYFKVSMPNGQTFNTIAPEFFSPSIPNPLSQVTAVFSIKQID